MGPWTSRPELLCSWANYWRIQGRNGLPTLLDLNELAADSHDLSGNPPRASAADLDELAVGG